MEKSIKKHCETFISKIFNHKYIQRNDPIFCSTKYFSNNTQVKHFSFGSSGQYDFSGTKKETVARKNHLIFVPNSKKSIKNYFKAMFVVILAVIANNAVFASQRDAVKVKSSYNKGLTVNGISNNNAVESFSVHEQMISKKFGTAKKVSPINEINNNSVFINSDNNNDEMKNFLTNNENTTSTSSYVIINTSPVSEKIPLNLSYPVGKIVTNKVNVPVPSNISGISRNSVEINDEYRNGPYFDKNASKNVTALLGKTAYLNCRVKNLGNKTMLLQVSWVRHRDIHLLTVGRYTYTSDQRFRAIHQPQTEDWILQIKYPQHRDSGIYECQVSTTPHMSHYIHLNVVEPSTEIVGAPDLYIESGSTINLTCVVLNSPEPPAYIFWNHNDAIINYDSPRGGVSVLTIKGETTTSFLLIKSAKPSDSGQYQCNPSNAKPKQVTVHVLNGEIPAAMQRAGQAHHHMSQNHYLFLYMLIYLFTSFYVKHFLQPPRKIGPHYLAK